jgi:hypothetical protein
MSVVKGDKRISEATSEKDCNQTMGLSPVTSAVFFTAKTIWCSGPNIYQLRQRSRLPTLGECKLLFVWTCLFILGLGVFFISSLYFNNVLSLNTQFYRWAIFDFKNCVEMTGLENRECEYLEYKSFWSNEGISEKYLRCLFHPFRNK